MEVYKLVKFDGMFFVSLSFSEFSTNYFINEKAIPGIGGIFVFKTINDAIEFAGKLKESLFHKDLVLLKGEAEGCRKISRVCSFTHQFEDFWKAKKNHKNTGYYVMLQEPPEGTLICSAFTPKEVVPFSWKQKG